MRWPPWAGAIWISAKCGRRRTMTGNQQKTNGLDDDATSQDEEGGPFVFEDRTGRDESPFFLTTDELWGWYGDGYFEAAKILLEHVKTARPRRKTLFYPILFLCRHWAELMLKAILLDSARTRRQPRPQLLTHKIMPLWETCRHLIEELWPEGPKDKLDAAEAFLSQLCQADKGCIAFRYPEDKKGARSLEGTALTSYGDLLKHMASLEELLYGVHAAILNLLDAIAEGEQYLAQEFSDEP